MALDATVLAGLIKPNMKTAFLACGAADNAALEALMTAMSTAIASAVVTHITTSGAVTVVTACPAGAGTGTGAVT
jgi:hypothetical protein